jgi:hypothetical protein
MSARRHLPSRPPASRPGMKTKKAQSKIMFAPVERTLDCAFDLQAVCLLDKAVRRPLASDHA